MYATGLSPWLDKRRHSCLATIKPPPPLSEAVRRWHKLTKGVVKRECKYESKTRACRPTVVIQQAAGPNCGGHPRRHFPNHSAKVRISMLVLMRQAAIELAHLSRRIV